MDSKTRFLMALAHEKPDRVPFNFWMDRRLMREYEDRIGHRHWRVTHYDADVIETFPVLSFPVGKHVEKQGSRWLAEPYPMSWSDVEAIPMPDASAEDVLAIVKQDIDEFPDRACIMNLPTAWGVIAEMRGYEQLYMDILDSPEAYHLLAQRITDVMKITVHNACKLGITALYIQEDVASTKGLTMSPAAIDEYCFTYARQLIAIAKDADIPVLFHCCGKVTELLGRFVELGVHALNPFQPHINDLRAFQAEYGSKLAIYGGLDNSFIISQGSTEEVRSHVFEVFETLGKSNGGLIFSTHDIDVNVPSENVETMVSAIKKCRY